jgi:hypothetical protein
MHAVACALVERLDLARGIANLVLQKGLASDGVIRAIDRSNAWCGTRSNRRLYKIRELRDGGLAMSGIMSNFLTVKFPPVSGPVN